MSRGSGNKQTIIEIHLKFSFKNKFKWKIKKMVFSMVSTVMPLQQQLYQSACEVEKNPRQIYNYISTMA